MNEAYSIDEINKATESYYKKSRNNKGITINITGKVPSKSSSRRIIFNRRTNRPMVISSKEVLQYEKDFASQITSKHKNTFSPEARLKVSINWYTDSLRQDIDAPAKAIFDNLQKNKVIKNDNRIDEYKITRMIDKRNPRVDIFIEAKDE